MNSLLDEIIINEEAKRRISFTSLQGIAIHQEMVIRYLKKHGSGSDWLKAYTEAKIVLESLDRMIEDHPVFPIVKKDS